MLVLTVLRRGRGLPHRSRAGRRGGCTAWAGALLLLTAVTAAEPAAGEPRPVTGAERRGVELAAIYLAEGAAGWLDELAPQHPWRNLSREQALAEIGVRAGPPQGAVWRLQTPAPGAPEERVVFSIEYPSGADETLVLTVANRGGWRIESIESLADPAAGDLLSSSASPSAPGPARPWPAPGFALLAALLLTAAAYPGTGRRRWGLGRGLSMAAAALCALLLAPMACGPGGAGEGGSAVGGAAAVDAPGLLGSLKPLRDAMALGEEPAKIDALFAAAPDDGPRAQIARLWKAQLLVWQVDLSEAMAILDALPEPSPVPLGEVLRARLALVRADLDNAPVAYDEAVRVGPDHDGLRLEAGQALALLGLTEDSEIIFTQLVEMGSRLADTYYAMAQISVLRGQPEAGEEYLRTAWGLEPVMREELFADPLLSTLCARPTLFPIFEFSRPQEPRVAPEERSRRPVVLPPGARASLAGEALRIVVGGSEVEVPGGADLAPVDVELEDAWHRRRQTEQEALAELSSRLGETGSVGSLAQPRRRQRLLEAVRALARQNLWEDLIRLTRGVAAAVDQVPAELVRLRAVALERTDRHDEAKRLLIDLAKSNIASRRRDPGTLYQLAELFVASGEYELAIRLIRKAATLSPLARNEIRLRQISMEQRLFETPQRWQSQHFEIVFPRITGADYPRDLAAVLEEERQRLKRWIPAGDGGERIEVNLFPVREFLRAYSTTTLVLGLYDGRVRVPFADLRSLHPELVAILTHELAHAMVGQATDDQAPHWFQEGLAQHVEMGTGRINPIPELVRTERVLAFSMIDPILRGFSEPQLVDLAYGESAWVVHYIESEHGVRAVRRLIDAFAAGKTTEEAVGEVLGLTVEELDRAAWRWCAEEAPQAWSNEVRRYDREHEGIIRRSAADEPAAPAAGPAAPRQRSSAALPPRELTMAAWHSAYRQRVRAFKQSLGQLLPALREGQELPPLACRGLGTRIDKLLADDQLFACPDERAGRALHTAFAHFAEMTQACDRGDQRRAQAALAEAERQLAEAARRLQPYGLKP